MENDTLGFLAEVRTVAGDNCLMLSGNGLKDEDIIEYQVNMMTFNEIPGLLNLTVRETNSQLQLCYASDGFITLKEHLKSNGHGYQELCRIMDRIFEVILENKKYFLNDNSYLIHEDLIYVAPGSGGIFLAYVPVDAAHRDILQVLRRLMLNLLIYVDAAETGAGLERQVLELVKDSSLTLKELGHRIKTTYEACRQKDDVSLPRTPKAVQPAGMDESGMNESGRNGSGMEKQDRSSQAESTFGSCYTSNYINDYSNNYNNSNNYGEEYYGMNAYGLDELSVKGPSHGRFGINGLSMAQSGAAGVFVTEAGKLETKMGRKACAGLIAGLLVLIVAIIVTITNRSDLEVFTQASGLRSVMGFQIPAWLQGDKYFKAGTAVIALFCGIKICGRLKGCGKNKGAEVSVKGMEAGHSVSCSSDETVFLSDATYPALKAVTGNETVAVCKPEFTLGRSGKECDYALGNKGIGRVHARIRLVNGCYYLEDLDSKNGTFINRDRLFSRKLYELKDGDRIRFADQEYCFSSNGVA